MSLSESVPSISTLDSTVEVCVAAEAGLELDGVEAAWARASKGLECPNLLFAAAAASSVACFSFFFLLSFSMKSSSASRVALTGSCVTGGFRVLGKGCEGVLRRDVSRRKTLEVMKLSNPAS